MRNPTVGLLTIVLLTGCASASKTYGPDGREAYAINCSGLARNWGMCYQKAGELCGTRGYEVIGQGGDSGVAVSAGQFGGFGGSVISRNLLITCKLAATQSPGPSGPASLNGTFTGELRGAAYGNAFAMQVTFTLVQNGDEVAGVWNTAGGTSGTVSGILRDKTVSLFRAKQLNPCEGEFTGQAAIEANGRSLRGSYVGRDCNGAVNAAFTVSR